MNGTLGMMLALDPSDVMVYNLLDCDYAGMECVISIQFKVVGC